MPAMPLLTGWNRKKRIRYSDLYRIATLTYGIMSSRSPCKGALSESQPVSPLSRITTLRTDLAGTSVAPRSATSSCIAEMEHAIFRPVVEIDTLGSARICKSPWSVQSFKTKANLSPAIYYLHGVWACRLHVHMQEIHSPKGGCIYNSH